MATSVRDEFDLDLRLQPVRMADDVPDDGDTNPPTINLTSCCQQDPDDVNPKSINLTSCCDPPS
jgi:hypothetical protein